MARRRYSADRCPICFNGLVLALETRCGHMFCGPCLRQYFVVGNHLLRVLTCPICREEITMVYMCFTEEEISSEDDEFCEERDEIREIMLQYNRNYSGEPRTVSEYFRDLPMLINYMWQEFASLGLMVRVRMILFLVSGVIYLIVPIDIFPEAVFGVMGLLDDVLLLSVIIVIVINNYRNLVINRVLEDQ